LRYPVGQPVRISTTVRDVTGALVDAGTLTLVVKLAQADGTWTAGTIYATPVHDGTGLYHQDVPAADLTVLGHYQYTWTATGTGAGVSFGDFDVFDPYETAVLPLQDAKDQLNIPQTVTTSDNELLSWIATIESSLKAMTGGPIVNRVITERAELDRTGQVLMLAQTPVVTVTSITSLTTGQAVDLSGGLDIDAAAGIVRSKIGWPFASTWPPVVTVVYVAGWGTAVPPAFNAAARIILAHLWETQHGPSVRPSMGGQDLLTAMPGFPYAIPRGAAELLRGTFNGMPFMSEVFA
jgi:hypothetical protein